MVNEAARSSWKTLPPPDQRAELEFCTVFTDAQGERMRQGHVPTDMDDKWFIFFENGWLHFHRSWTGAEIFALKLDGSPAGVRVVDGWASRAEEQYRSSGIERDQELILTLIRSYFGD